MSMVAAALTATEEQLEHAGPRPDGGDVAGG